MSLEDDINLVCERSGSDRFRELTNPDHPEFHTRYLIMVSALAKTFRTGQPGASEVVKSVNDNKNHVVINISDRQHQIQELERIRSCKHLTLCGCGGGRLGDCALGLGDNGKVNLSDCQPCTKWEHK